MSELRRILDLPRVEYPDHYEWSVEYARHGRPPPLLPDQCRFLAACAHANNAEPSEDGLPGVLGAMSCGSGKTLALQLAPKVFGVSSFRSVLITEANLLPQLRKDIEFWSGHYRLAQPRTLTYGKLSHPTGEDILDRFGPKLILLDEAHKLGRGARARRLWRYVEQNRDCRVVAVSGSLLGAAIRDLADLANLTLRHWSPFPHTDGVLEHWASVLDVGGEPSAVDHGALRKVIAWAANTMPADAGPKAVARNAVRARFRTAPGVLVTDGPLAVGPSLRLEMQEPPTSPALQTLETRWELPDGTQLVDMLEYARHADTLRLGFYYRFKPDTVNDEWMEARRRWNGVVRAMVDCGQFDTPYFVADAVEHGRLGQSQTAVYQKWASIRDRYPVPERETVWVGDGEARLREMIELWRAAHPDSIIWYHSKAIENLVIPRVETVTAKDEPPDTAGCYLMSLAHRQGWNGQRFNTALVLQPPRSAREMEQLLARLHRRGQTEDVYYRLYCTARDRERVHAKAVAVRDLVGTAQRYLVADWLDAEFGNWS